VRRICGVIVADYLSMSEELIAQALLRRHLRKSFRSVARLVVPGNENQLQWEALRERPDEIAAGAVTACLPAYDLPSASQILNILHYAKLERLCLGQEDEIAGICSIVERWERNDGALAALHFLYERIGGSSQSFEIDEVGIDGVASRFSNHVLQCFWESDAE
jgi:hypothetical protein